jgi:hypothetical protein
MLRAMLSSASANRFFARADFSTASVCLRVWNNMGFNFEGSPIGVVLMRLMVEPAPALPRAPGVL